MKIDRSRTYDYPGGVAKDLLPRIERARNKQVDVARRNAQQEIAATTEHDLDVHCPLPSAEVLRELLDCSFFASLLEEEARQITFSVAYIGRVGVPESVRVVELANELPFRPETLRKLTPALDPWGTHIGVHIIDGELRVWGLIFFGSSTFNPTAKTYPRYLLLRAIYPGFLRVELRSHLLMSYGAGNAHILGEDDGYRFLDVARIIARALEVPELMPPIAGHIFSIAKSMLRHRHGGTLLVVPFSEATDVPALSRQKRLAIKSTSKQLLLDPVRAYESAKGKIPPVAMVQQLGCAAVNGSVMFCAAREVDIARSRIREAVEEIGLLTAVDGATLLSRDGELLGFGVMIKSAARISKVRLFEATDLNRPGRIVPIESLGGARHQSAARFCAAQKNGAVAIVASQDGAVSLVAKLPQRRGVGVWRPFDITDTIFHNEGGKGT